MNRILLRSMLVVFLFLCICTEVFALVTTPSEMWNTYTLQFPMIAEKKLYFDGLFETRFDEDMSHLFRYQFYIGPSFKYWKYLDLALKYGLIQEQFPVRAVSKIDKEEVIVDDVQFQTENRIMAYLVPRCSLSDLGVDILGLGKFRLSMETRFDFRFRSYRDQLFSWRFRLYPSIAYPVYESKNLVIEPWAKQAVYFQPENGLDTTMFFCQARTLGGVTFTLYGHTQLSAYYMFYEQRPKPDAEWEASNIFGTIIGYKF